MKMRWTMTIDEKMSEQLEQAIKLYQNAEDGSRDEKAAVFAISERIAYAQECGLLVIDPADDGEVSAEQPTSQTKENSVKDKRNVNCVSCGVPMERSEEVVVKEAGIVYCYDCLAKGHMDGYMPYERKLTTEPLQEGFR